MVIKTFMILEFDNPEYNVFRNNTDGSHKQDGGYH